MKIGIGTGPGRSGGGDSITENVLRSRAKRQVTAVAGAVLVQGDIDSAALAQTQTATGTVS